MSIDKSKVKKILVISLSNIGDIILTFPVLDILRSDFPSAKVSVVIGPKGEPLFNNNPFFDRIYLYQKRQPIPKLLSWIGELRREKFDLVVDLRNTAIPFMLWPRYRTSFILHRDKTRHMRDQHLNRLRSVYRYPENSRRRDSLFIRPDEQKFIDDIIRTEVSHPDRIIVVSPGAADQRKRWNEAGFAIVCDRLMSDHRASVVFIGDAADKEGVARIQTQMRNRAVDVSGRATLVQVAHLLSRTKLLLSNDSSPMHLASYLNVPVVALFGPTNSLRYGPWSPGSVVVKKENADESVSPEADVMRLITVDDVLAAVAAKLK